MTQKLIYLRYSKKSVIVKKDSKNQALFSSFETMYFSITIVMLDLSYSQFILAFMKLDSYSKLTLSLAVIILY